MSRNPIAAAAAPTLDEVVRFDDVSMRYGRGPEVLRDLDFALAPGSFHFVTGPSGAGKSSLLQADLPGRPAVEGPHPPVRPGRRPAPAPQTRPQLRRRIGVVFQDLLLLDHLSAFDNAALPLRIAGAQAVATTAPTWPSCCAWVGLGERMHAMPPTLAGGEKQRLAIARAVVNRPEILLADEPTGNVDHEMALRIFRLFVELNRLGTTVLIATHDQDLVARSGRPVAAPGGRPHRLHAAAAGPALTRMSELFDPAPLAARAASCPSARRPRRRADLRGRGALLPGLPDGHGRDRRRPRRQRLDAASSPARPRSSSARGAARRPTPPPPAPPRRWPGCRASPRPARWSRPKAYDLIRPWLGDVSDLEDLPVPRLVAVSLDPRQPGRRAGAWTRR